jgi:2-polyprenyl-3-methyl-5-hydroxy-6-metoxy-1,4-benzoquinol methylase
MEYLKEMADGGYNPESIHAFHRFMVPWLMKSEGVSVASTVVDFGAGQGHCLIPLQEQGWRSLIAVDVDDFNFNVFERKYGIRTVKCNLADQKVALANGSADVILCFHVIEHLWSPENLMKEAHRILRPGGKLFLVTPDWKKSFVTFWGDPTHVKPYDKIALARLMRMYGFSPMVRSWNARFGVGRARLYKLWPRLGFIGREAIATGLKL